MMPYVSDWSQKKKKKSSFFFRVTLHHLTGPISRAYICWSDVPKILCLQHPGIVANWTDFKPPFQNKVHSSLGFVCSHLPNIYTKRINPQFATEGACNHIYVSFHMHMLLSDIWSRSNFWATLHFLSADVSNTIDPFTHLQTESVTFVAHVAFINKIVYMQCRTLW